MITDTCSIKISEDEKFVVYQYNDPIYDDKGDFTGKWEDSNPNIITLVKFPPFY